MNAINKRARLICACIALVAGACTPRVQAEDVHRVSARSISFPITYADAYVPGVMLFMNEDEGMIAVGNRDPGNWRIFGPPPPWVIKRCRAKEYNCLTGVAGYHPIVVGEMEFDRREEFADLGIATVRRKSQICDTFETTPLNQSSIDWKQDIIFCTGLGIVQISLTEDGHEVGRLDLKSAQGLFSPDGYRAVEIIEAPPR